MGHRVVRGVEHQVLVHVVRGPAIEEPMSPEQHRASFGNLHSNGKAELRADHRLRGEWSRAWAPPSTNCRQARLLEHQDLPRVARTARASRRRWRAAGHTAR